MNKLFNHPCPECICLPICRNKLNKRIPTSQSLKCSLYQQYFTEQIKLASTTPNTNYTILLNQIFKPFNFKLNTQNIKNVEIDDNITTITFELERNPPFDD